MVRGFFIPVKLFMFGVTINEYSVFIEPYIVDVIAASWGDHCMFLEFSGALN